MESSIWYKVTDSLLVTFIKLNISTVITNSDIYAGITNIYPVTKQIIS